MAKRQYYVWIPGQDDEDEKFECSYMEWSAEDAAEAHAKYCYSNRDGWEWLWNCTDEFEVICGGEVRRFRIVTESEPVFCANEVDGDG